MTHADLSRPTQCRTMSETGRGYGYLRLADTLGCVGWSVRAGSNSVRESLEDYADPLEAEEDAPERAQILIRNPVERAVSVLRLMQKDDPALTLNDLLDAAESGSDSPYLMQQTVLHAYVRSPQWFRLEGSSAIAMYPLRRINFDRLVRFKTLTVAQAQRISTLYAEDNLVWRRARPSTFVYL